MNRIDESYPTDSFPHRLLSRLLEAGDEEAVAVAVRLLERVREEPA